MQTRQPSLIARDHTLLGVCEALGEDFGFNAVYLRVALAVLLLWNPTVVVGTYLAAAVVVFLSRLASPNPRARSTSAARAEPAQSAPANEVDEDLAVAA